MQYDVAKNVNIQVKYKYLRSVHFTPLFTLQGQQSHRMVILAAIFVLMTLLILYGSNNINEEIYAPFHVAANHALKTTDLKKWAGREGYVPINGNKVLNRLHTNNKCSSGTSVNFDDVEIPICLDHWRETVFFLRADFNTSVYVIC